ncbi:hypothetical protein RFI_04264, partial [Reticulomyxa filosa]
LFHKNKHLQLEHTATFVTKRTGDLFDCFLHENHLMLELWETRTTVHSQSDHLIGSTQIDLSQLNLNGSNNKSITELYPLQCPQSYGSNKAHLNAKVRVRICLQIEPHSNEEKLPASSETPHPTKATPIFDDEDNIETFTSCKGDQMEKRMNKKEEVFDDKIT